MVVSLSSAGDGADSSVEERLSRVLMDEPELRPRARAHLELARLNLAQGRVEGCVLHLREALLLDRRLDAASHMLQELGASAGPMGSDSEPRGVLRALLGRLRRT